MVAIGLQFSARPRDYDLTVSGVRADIEQQQGTDRSWQSYASVLEARMVAVHGARRAFAGREPGAGWAFRQSLVDLASVCELLAGELPRPHGPATQTPARRVKRAV